MHFAPPAPLAPSVRKLSAESGIEAATVPGSGRDGRVTKGDMLAAIENPYTQIIGHPTGRLLLRREKDRGDR